MREISKKKAEALSKNCISRDHELDLFLERAHSIAKSGLAGNKIESVPR